MTSSLASRFLVVAALAVAITGCSSATGASPPHSLAPAAAPTSDATPPQAVPTATPTSQALSEVGTPEEAVARVVVAEPRFAGIGPVEPDLIGQSSWYTVEPAPDPGAYVVRFRIGSGDCPSGCIDEHIWVYAVARDGTVSLVSESGDPVPSDPNGIDGGGVPAS